MVNGINTSKNLCPYIASIISVWQYNVMIVVTIYYDATGVAYICCNIFPRNSFDYIRQDLPATNIT